MKYLLLILLFFAATATKPQTESNINATQQNSEALPALPN